MSEFTFARCPKCGPVVDGNYVGNVMYEGRISVYHRTKPYSPLAKYNRCNKCGYIDRIWLLPEADKNISLYDVKNCFKQMPLDAYTMAELKAGKVRGVGEVELDIQYDPDKTIENRVDKEFE